MSCEKVEFKRSPERDNHAVRAEDSILIEDSGLLDEQPSISLELESDSLEDEVEEIYFYAEDWEEELIDTDL